MSEYIAVLLHAVGILLGYGHQLLATVRHHAATPTFPSIAACSDTADLSTILAHLNRGILRATALERMLLARAATGRDINIVTRRTREAQIQPAPTDPQAEPPADQPAKPKAAPRPSLPPGWDDPELFMPTPEDLDRQVRRRAVGRTITDICRDLAVVPGFCTSAFWNRLFELMHYFGGNVATMMREKAQRDQMDRNHHDLRRGLRGERRAATASNALTRTSEEISSQSKSTGSLSHVSFIPAVCAKMSAANAGLFFG